jgi:replicative DNA helicase
VAYDNEIRLLSRAVRERDIGPILDAAVKDEWFENQDCRAFWKWMRTHWTKYGEVPTATSAKAEFPTFTLLEVHDSLQYLVDKFVEYRRYVLIEDTVQSAVATFKSTNDHEAVMAELEKGLAVVNRETSIGATDARLDEDPESRYKDYEELEARGGALLGLPTGFALIDEATAGLCPGQLITIIALPKTGKSVLALRIAMHMHDLGKNILFHGFEMSNWEQRERHDAIRSHVSYQRFRRGNLNPGEKARYKKMLADMMMSSSAFTLSENRGGSTVSSLAAKIERNKPDIVFVDGVYLMWDEQTGERGTPQAITNITRSLKELAQRTQLPIVISTQVLPWKTKSGKVTADSIGYSSSFYQDSDVILALERVDGDDELRELRVEESRNCGKEDTLLVWRWETGCFHDESESGTCTFCASVMSFMPSIPII